MTEEPYNALTVEETWQIHLFSAFFLRPRREEFHEEKQLSHVGTFMPPSEWLSDLKANIQYTPLQG